MIEKPDEAAILGGLKDFQRRTVDYVFQQLYLENTTDRFLIADEVGLGKTLVAKGVLAKTINYLWDKAKRINVLYICSNADIAHQNIDKLNITGDPELEHTSRITLLPLQIKGLKNEKLNFISFTPGTSFNLRSQSGIALERVLIYHMLKEGWGFGERSGAKNLFQCGKTKDNWRNDLRRFEPGRIDQDIKHSFLQALEEKPEIRRRFDDLVERFGHYRKAFALEDRRERDRLIGDLRGILAEECIKKLKPDLVILDEFQRFKTLLDGEDEMATLARRLFNYPGVKILLLSATPYKMYTMYHESDEDGHYQDFIRHVLQDTQGLAYKPADYRIIEMAEKIVEAATLRTASLEFDEIDVEKEEMLDPKDPKRIRCHYALRFGDGKDDEEGQGNRAEQVRAAFNSPFRPFILATTSVGQEGLDFHLYCHEIYHWNLPSNPVDLEQREGRIHRYKGHAIRRNVALAFGPFLAEAGESKDPWENLFNLAEASRLSGQNDLIPYWIYEIADGYIIVRHVPALPLSRELGKLENLKRSLAAYRMVIGQPRQEDLLKYLEARLATDLHLQELERLRINLEPGS